MFTVVKSLLAEVPTSQEHHATHDKIKVMLPRFDKYIQSINEKRRDQGYKNSHSAAKIRQNRREKSYGQTLDFKIGSKHRDMTPNRMGSYAFYEGPPMIDTKDFKQ